MSNFIQNLRSAIEGTTDKTFFDSEINKKAKEDFKFLCTQLQYNCMQNVNYLSVKQGTSDLIDCLVFGHDMSSNKASFPKDIFDINNNVLYAAVVGYKKGITTDIYLFKASNFKKTGLFSMYSCNKKNNTYSIKLPSTDKLKEYSFGYVIKNISEGEQK